MLSKGGAQTFTGGTWESSSDIVQNQFGHGPSLGLDSFPGLNRCKSSL